jgi:hypothetical protein
LPPQAVRPRPSIRHRLAIKVHCIKELRLKLTLAPLIQNWE